jgi:micrococcal nuclease
VKPLSFPLCKQAGLSIKQWYPEPPTGCRGKFFIEAADIERWLERAVVVSSGWEPTELGAGKCTTHVWRTSYEPHSNPTHTARLVLIESIVRESEERQLLRELIAAQQFSKIGVSVIVDDWVDRAPETPGDKVKIRLPEWFAVLLLLCVFLCLWVANAAQPASLAASQQERLEPNHVYHAKITHVADGDTADAEIDIGFKIHLEDIPLRFYGINTPELKSEDPAEAQKALLAKQFTEKKILNKPVTLQFQKQSGSEKDDKYGRYLAVIYYTNRAGVQIDLNDELIKQGLAKEYFP